MPKLFYRSSETNFNRANYVDANDAHKAANNSRKNLVLVFPGNSTHHSEGVGLFTFKVENCLVVNVRDISLGSYPTLSLPIHLFEGDEQKKSLPSQAIGELYRTLGAGYALLLITRPKTVHGDKFFNGELAGHSGHEPAFWDGSMKEDPELAAYYLRHLNILHHFCSYIDRNETVDEAVRLMVSDENLNLNETEQADFNKFVDLYKRELSSIIANPIVFPV